MSLGTGVPVGVRSSLVARLGTNRVPEKLPMTSHPDDPMDSRHALPEHSLPGRLPDLVVIGATKAGTTSLYRYLGEHPQIFMSTIKEPRYFMDPFFEGNYHRGVDWYRNLFRTQKTLCGEATPAYTQPLTTVVAERMHQTIPEAKVIYLVREPWSRLLSHNQMIKSKKGCLRASLAEIVENHPRAKRSSFYGSHFRNFRQFFPANQILIVESSDLLSQTRDTLRKIFSFLGVDSGFLSPVFDLRFNSTRSTRADRPVDETSTSPTPDFCPQIREIIPAALIREWHGRFHAEVDLLRQLTGQPFPSLELPPLERLLAEHT